MNDPAKPPARASAELIVIAKAYDLARELTRRVGKYPRSHRFLLGDRTLNAAYDLLELLIEAKYRSDKTALLDRANLLLERMRFQVRLAHDEQCINATGYGVVARQMDEVGRLIGGWKRSRSKT
jgi:hypothetical protein